MGCGHYPLPIPLSVSMPARYGSLRLVSGCSQDLDSGFVVVPCSGEQAGEAHTSKYTGLPRPRRRNNVEFNGTFSSGFKPVRWGSLRRVYGFAAKPYTFRNDVILR